MAAEIVNIEQGTQAWHDWRKTGIGASDMAALFGKSPYKTKRDLWFEKAGFGEPDEEDRSYIYQRGHEAEAEIREKFYKHTKIEMRPVCFQNGIFLGSLDGHERLIGLLEAKLVGKEVLKGVAAGEVPEHHRIQVQAQLHASDSDKAFYAATAPKVKDVFVVEIGRDEKFIKQSVAAGVEFWESLQSGKAPELSADDYLFITDPEQIGIFRELRQVRAQRDVIDARYTELEQLAKSLAVHPRVRCEDITITDSERSGAIDYLKIPEVKALAQEYLEKFRKKSSLFKTLRFKKEA